MTTNAAQALERASAYLETNRPGVIAVGLFEDSRDFLVRVRYPHNQTPVGESTILVRKATGRVWLLPSAEVGRKASAMTEVMSNSS